MNIKEKLREYDLEIVNFIVGAVVLTFELVAARIITPYIGNTIYTWTSIIGIILAALAAGYWVGGRLADDRKNQNDVVLLLIVASTCILAVNFIKDWALNIISGNSLPMQVQALLAGLSLFMLPTILLGAVSPYLTRLRIKDLKTSGARVARMSAWGTIGSLFGTFAAGYVLFGYVGTKGVLSILVITLVAASFIVNHLDYLPQRLALVVGVLLSISWVGPVSAQALVSDTDTRYTRVIIRDMELNNRPARVLQTDGRFYQSGEYLDGSKDLTFGYTRILDFVSRLRPDMKNMLIIGGGAYTLPSHFAQSMPSATIDTIEIDDGLQALGEKYFGFKKASNLNIYNQDGRAYLNRTTESYDMIIIDAYASVIPPYQLLTKEAIIRMQEALKAKGFVAANIVSPRNKEPLLNIVKTYKNVFKHVVVLPTLPSHSETLNQNIILLASDIPIEKADLLQHAISQEEKRSVGGLYTPVTDDSIIMTDNFAPIERYSTANL